VNGLFPWAGDNIESKGRVGMAAALDEEQDLRLAARDAEKVDRRRWRRDEKEALDELLPKATGRWVAGWTGGQTKGWMNIGRLGRSTPRTNSPMGPCVNHGLNAVRSPPPVRPCV
jgi:hypothetical protein